MSTDATTGTSQPSTTSQPATSGTIDDRIRAEEARFLARNRRSGELYERALIAMTPARGPHVDLDDPGPSTTWRPGAGWSSTRPPTRRYASGPPR